MSRHLSLLSSVLAGVPLLLLSACGSDSDSGSTNSSGASLQILDPAQPHFGKSYAEWGTAWWKWTYENPGPKHPLTDTTGADCGVNQSGEVFYLVGTLGGSATRSCTVPVGKALFFPIVNISADNAGVPAPDQMTDEQLQGFANGMLASVKLVELDLDGKSVGAELGDFAQFLGAATPYTYTVPDTPDNFYRKVAGLDFAGQVDPSYSRGYWVMLAPPKPGAHTIHFRARAEPEGGAPFELEVTYDLNVQ